MDMIPTDYTAYHQITSIPTGKANPVITKNGINPSIARGQLNAGIWRYAWLLSKYVDIALLFLHASISTLNPLVKEKVEEHV